MLNGTHILMGYETQAYLCDDFAEVLADRLQRYDYDDNTGKYIEVPVINAFFAAGDQGESKRTEDNHIQVAYYVRGTRYETIYAKPVECSSDPSNIYKITNGINDDTIYR